MAVHGSVPMTGEMFCTSTDTCFFHGCNKFRNLACCCLRVGRKGSGANHRVIRIGIHIRNGCKIHIDTKFRQFCANRLAFICCIHNFRRIGEGFMRNVTLFQTGNQTTFFIDTNEHSIICRTLQVCSQFLCLFFCVQVFRKKNDPTNMIFLNGCFCFIRKSCHSRSVCIVAKICHDELARFFRRIHIVDNRLYIFFFTYFVLCRFCFRYSAGRQRKRHTTCQKHCQYFLHSISPS